MTKRIGFYGMYEPDGGTPRGEKPHTPEVRKKRPRKKAPPLTDHLERRIRFSSIPFKPTHPQFNAELGPAGWRQWCWEQSPPQCPECGNLVDRKKHMIARETVNKSVDGSHKFCTTLCYKRYQYRLELRLVPIEYRSQYPLDLPSEITEWHERWNRLAPGGTGQVSEKCGAVCNSYPTQTWPLNTDNRGKLCEQPAGKGTKHLGFGRCESHGGRNANVTEKDQRGLAEKLMREDRIRFGQIIEVSPEEAIMQELWRSNGAVEWYRQKIELLASGGASEDEAIVQFTKMGMTPSIWVQLYNEERGRLAGTAKVAAGMGVAERQIRIAEEQGRMLATVIQALMIHPLLALTPMQQINAKDAIRDVLSTIKMPEALNPASITMPDGLTKQAHAFLDEIDDEDDELQEL